MQETFLRRDRDDHASVGQQDRLAQLQVPVPQRQPLALEGRDRKIRTLEEIEHRFRIARIYVRAAASPIMRTAVQACMSSAVMCREFSLRKRFCIWIAPH